MLTLPIKRKWFDMILSGEKEEEYREMTRYWRTRLTNIGLLNGYGFGFCSQWIRFRNGYAKNSPSFIAYVSADVKKGRPEWGAEPGKEYYALKIKEIKRE